MIHLALLLVCIFCVEIFLRFNFIAYLESFLKLSKKISHILLNEKISDHWKEIVIPFYALKIMKLSSQIFFILISIIILFIFTNIFIDNFLIFILSIYGIIESIAFSIIYFFFRRVIS